MENITTEEVEILKSMVRSDSHVLLVYWIPHVQNIISLLFKGSAKIGSFVASKKSFWDGIEFQL